MGSGVGPRVYGIESVSVKLDLGNKFAYSGSGNTSISIDKTKLLSSSVTFTDSNSASYYTFGGAGIVTSSSLVGISGANSRTLSAWVYLTSATNQAVLSFGANGTGTGFSLETTNTVWKLGYGNSGLATTITYSLNTWYHVVYVGESSSSNSLNLKLYVNGYLKHSVSASSINTTNTTLKIGTDPSGVLKLNGRVSVATSYKRALSSSEILSNYLCKKSRYGL